MSGRNFSLAGYASTVSLVLSGSCTSARKLRSPKLPDATCTSGNALNIPRTHQPGHIAASLRVSQNSSARFGAGCVEPVRERLSPATCLTNGDPCGLENSCWIQDGHWIDGTGRTTSQVRSVDSLQLSQAVCQRSRAYSLSAESMPAGVHQSIQLLVPKARDLRPGEVLQSVQQLVQPVMQLAS